MGAKDVRIFFGHAGLQAQGLIERAAGQGEVVGATRAAKHFSGIAPAATIKGTIELTDSTPGSLRHIPLWEWRSRA